MKSIDTLLSLKTLAATLAGIGLFAGALGQANALEANLLGTPDDGMVCRSGYTGGLTGAAFKCSKTVDITLVLECNSPAYPTYVVRAPGSVGTPDGKDICTRNGVVVTSTDDISKLVRGKDYEFAQVNQTTITTRTNNQDQAEANALGLNAAEVDTVASPASIQLNGGVGSKDNARVTLTHYTFAIKTGGIIGGQLPQLR